MSDLSTTGLPVLEVSRLGKRFAIGEQTIAALHDVNLSVHKGEFVCLIGASGCGKSTLLRILAGFEQASSGTALMYGMPITGPSPERGMVFQDYALFPWLTVRQNIAFGPHQRGSPPTLGAPGEADEAVVMVLQVLPLHHRALPPDIPE